MFDYDEPIFCECGVTLLDGEDQCHVCAGAPHERECPCDVCEAYWHRIAEESRVAADRANRALVCSCGWTGAFIEHHNSKAYGPIAQPDCVMAFRDPERDGLLLKRWTGSEWEDGQFATGGVVESPLPVPTYGCVESRGRSA